MTTDDPQDDLYDQYVEAALAGEAESPEAFCARRGGVSAELRVRLEALFRLLHSQSSPTVAVPVPAPGLPQERLGEYRLLKRLGAGGMGVVYLAEQESLRRMVALKLLRPELAGSPTAAERLRREAHAIAKLRHPSIVEVYAFGEEDGVRYRAMQLVPGDSLADRLHVARENRQPLLVAEVLRWIEPIARALDHAHQTGVLHRDVKPSNLRLNPEGRALLVDFGLAREIGSDAPSLTEYFVGSPAYVSPEQIAGNRAQIGAPSDIWSLGVTLYESLTLELPFSGDEIPRLFQRILHETPVSPRRLRPEIPRDLEQVILQCLEKEPPRRYASAGALADDLAAALEFRPVTARAPRLLERARRWVRSHRTLAATGFTLLITCAGALTWRALEAQAEQRARVEDAAALIRQAQELMVAHASEERELTTLENQWSKLALDMRTNYVPPAEARLLDREGELKRRHRELAMRTRKIEQLLLQAERMDPHANVQSLRAELYLTEWRGASDPEAETERAFLAGLVAENDAEGRHAAEIAGTITMSITSDPPGASVYLFHYRPQSELFEGGEYRLVPCPVGSDDPPIAPGSVVLRLTEDSDNLFAEDVVLEIDGVPVAQEFPGRTALERASRGGTARVIRGSLTPGRGGLSENVELPAHLRLLPTAAPLLVTPSSYQGSTPINSLELARGCYLVLLRLEGYVPVRARLSVYPDQPKSLRVELPHVEDRPPGCAWIGNPLYASAPFWMQEREVTAAEWLEFLNDPETRDKIERSPTPILVPRRSDTRTNYCIKDAEGQFHLGPGWASDWPVLGISFQDAMAYVQWKNLLDDLDLHDLEWHLPTAQEWRSASHGHVGIYVWGASFRPYWCNACFALPHPNPVAVMSFPIDESGYGVLDLAGSASEWCESWFDNAAKGYRYVAGGNWGAGEPENFLAEAASGQPPEFAAGVFGLRLVARRKSNLR